MVTVIGIFEEQFKRNKPLTVVKPEINQEDLHMLMIPWTHVFMHLKLINVDTIASQKVILF